MNRKEIIADQKRTIQEADRWIEAAAQKLGYTRSPNMPAADKVKILVLAAKLKTAAERKRS